MSKIKKHQIEKISKEFLSILLRGSVHKQLNELPTKTIEEYFTPRFDQLQRKYGYSCIVATIPQLLDIVTINPVITLKHQTVGEMKVTVEYEALSKYYDELTSQKASNVAV